MKTEQDFDMESCKTFLKEIKEYLKLTERYVLLVDGKTR